MKFKRLSVQLGLSFALISGFATMPTPVQAQISTDIATDISTDFNVVTTDETGESAFSTDFATLLDTLIASLEEGSPFQRRLASLLRSSDVDIDAVRSSGTFTGIDPAEARGLLTSLAGALTGSPEEQANKLIGAITTYNTLISNLESATLNNPPQSIIEIQQLLLQISNEATSGDD
ncbi:MAG: hypothetical protein GVY04_19010 [Cyanobacteria bacterium]|jgi:hypothetical protein|nr:hypothetical protein [Cyanobacteria bacterium GSL.Bin1]